MNESAQSILAHLPYPIWVLTAAAGGRRGGLVATFVSRASIVEHMPRVCIGLSVRHHTTELVRHASACALHLLTEADVDWVWRFGLVSGRTTDKLAGVDFRAGSTGSPILTEAAAWLECRIETSMETGDRTVFLAEVVDAETADVAPLTVDRLRSIAPPGELARMDEHYARDAEVDAQLIDLFRKRHR